MSVNAKNIDSPTRTPYALFPRTNLVNVNDPNILTMIQNISTLNLNLVNKSPLSYVSF